MALNLTGFAPTVTIQTGGAQQIELPPSGALNLVSFAPTKKVIQRKSIPSSNLVLVGNTPKDYIRIINQVPGSILTLTVNTPLTKQIINRLIPSGSLTLVPGTPATSQSGQIIKSVPSARLRLVSYSPNIPSLAKVKKTAGGGPRRTFRKVVLIGGRRYKVESYTELRQLLLRFLNEQQSELSRIEPQQPKSKRVVTLKKNITRTETRLAKAEEAWQIERENEELLLMLVA